MSCHHLQRYWDLLVLISRPDLSARLLQENMAGGGNGDAPAGSAGWAAAAVQAMQLSENQRAALASAWQQHRDAVQQRAAKRQELLSAIRSGFLVVSEVPTPCSAPRCRTSPPRVFAEWSRLLCGGPAPKRGCRPPHALLQRALANHKLLRARPCVLPPCLPPSLQHLQRASPEDIELGKPLARQGLGAMEALRLVVRQEHVSAVQLACGLRKVGPLARRAAPPLGMCTPVGALAGRHGSAPGPAAGSNLVAAACRACPLRSIRPWGLGCCGLLPTVPAAPAGSQPHCVRTLLAGPHLAAAGAAGSGRLAVVPRSRQMGAHAVGSHERGLILALHPGAQAQPSGQRELAGCSPNWVTSVGCLSSAERVLCI